MTNKEEWNDFLENIFNNAMKKFEDRCVNIDMNKENQELAIFMPVPDFISIKNIFIFS